MGLCRSTFGLSRHLLDPLKVRLTKPGMGRLKKGNIWFWSIFDPHWSRLCSRGLKTALAIPI